MTEQLDRAATITDGASLREALAVAFHADECGCPDGYDPWHMDTARMAVQVLLPLIADVLTEAGRDADGHGDRFVLAAALIRSYLEETR